MIERHWKGIAKKERADDYIIHLQQDTFIQLSAMNGFISASILQRDVNEGIEFLIITKWKTMDTIRQFAGATIDKAVVPSLVKDIMMAYDDQVKHYEVSFETKNNLRS